MSQLTRAVRSCMPDQLRRLMQATEDVQTATEELRELEAVIVADIKKGWTTGDRLLDFVLVVCDGEYESSIIEEQYRSLAELPLSSPGKEIIVVQEAEHQTKENTFVARNIYIATLRCGQIEFDVDKRILVIPVEPLFFANRGVLRINDQDGDEDEDVDVQVIPNIVGGKWLHVGALYNYVCYWGEAKPFDNKGAMYAPEDAIARIYPHPWDLPTLYKEHGIDAELLHELRKQWILMKSQYVKERT